MEADSHVCLKWNHHQSTVVSVFENLLDSGTLVDCTVAAEGRCLRAHRLILSSCSPFFALLFSQHYEKHPIVVLKDVRFQELRAVVDYMYRGEVSVPQEELGALLEAAKSLQIKGLSDGGEESADAHVEAGGGRGRQSGAAAEHSAKPSSVTRLPTDAEVVDLSDDSLSSADTRETFRAKRRDRSPVDSALEPSHSLPACHENKLGNSSSTTEYQRSSVRGTSGDPQVSSAVSALAVTRLTSAAVPEPVPQNTSPEVPENNTARVKCENSVSKATVLIPPPERTTVTLKSPLQKPAALLQTPVKSESEVMDTDDEFTGDISRDFAFSDVDCAAAPRERQFPFDDVNFLGRGMSIERVVDWTCDVHSDLPRSKRPSFSRCKVCGKEYKYFRNLSKHLKYECGKEPQFRCRFCPARYTQNGTLRKHLERYHQRYDSVK